MDVSQTNGPNHVTRNDCVTTFAVYKTMYENVLKIAVNATCRKINNNNFNKKIAYLMFALRYFDVSGVPREKRKAGGLMT